MRQKPFFSLRRARLFAAINGAESHLWDEAKGCFRDNPTSHVLPQDGNAIAIWFKATTPVRKRPFLPTFYAQRIILSRQARDKHRENSQKRQKETVFSQARRVSISSYLKSNWGKFGSSSPEWGGDIGTFPVCRHHHVSICLLISSSYCLSADVIIIIVCLLMSSLSLSADAAIIIIVCLCVWLQGSMEVNAHASMGDATHTQRAIELIKLQWGCALLLVLLLSLLFLLSGLRACFHLRVLACCVAFFFLSRPSSA